MDLIGTLRLGGDGNRSSFVDSQLVNYPVDIYQQSISDHRDALGWMLGEVNHPQFRLA